MMRASAPQRCDFDTEEDYEYAIDCYECEEDLYAEDYFLRKRGFDF
jgi:hypothetical protein